jgi:tRNA pseudouridine38-40 synthase
MKYKVTLAYDGWNYAGFQKQINATGIQTLIEKALYKIANEPIDITASGRTDAKVHAKGQVFHFESSRNMAAQNWMKALNALLPPDVRILSVEEVDEDFHARFSAKKKRYEYICSTDVNDPFSFRYKYLIPFQPDLEAMKQGAAYLEGTHDFTSFCSSKIHPDKPRTKTIDSIAIWQEGNDIHFSYVGSGFLRYQVRMMSAALLACGQHKISPQDIKEILEAKNKDACRYNAPGQGLYLMEVSYE